MEKTCRTCRKRLPLADFSKDKSMADGVSGACRACRRAANRSRYAAHRAEILQRQAIRYAAHPDARRLANRKYRQSDTGRSVSRTIKDRYRAEHPDRVRAKAAVQNALRNGTLRTLPCEMCGESPAEGHHPNYSKPLSVVWLCRKHHAQVHALTHNLPTTARVAA